MATSAPGYRDAPAPRPRRRRTKLRLVATRQTALAAGGFVWLGLVALLLFNLGVEAGQITFVLFVLALVWLGRHLYRQGEPALRVATAYAIGITGSYWAIERIVGVFL